MPALREMWWARWSLWTIGSAILTSLVIGNAVYQKKQFYPTVVYITKSKPSMAVMYAQGLLFVVMMGKLFRKLFFGQLRAAEFEHLVERSWYAVTETCLAFTVFRDDFSPKFLALFTLLLFLKSFHWLAEERVDFMERSPVITWIFHVRVLSLLTLLIGLDIYFVNMAYQSTMAKGASVQLVFGFEYAILTTIVFNILAKYVFHVIDMQNEAPWENKAVYVLHTDVIIGLLKVILYICFVVIMVRIYTLPLFALRPTYLAIRAFKKAFVDIIMSRRAISNMNNLYPDVTAEELAASDNVCIICREEMTGGAKKLPCNHIFHTSCLRSWFQRQQTCPTCRLNVLRTPAPTPPRNMPAFNLNQFHDLPGGRLQAGFFRGPELLQMWNGGGNWAQQQPNNAPRPAPPTANGQAGAGPSTAETSSSTQPEAAGPNPGPSSQPTDGSVRPPPPFTFGPFPPFGYPNQLFQQNPQQTMPGAPVSPTNPPAYPFNIPPMPFIPLVPPPPPLLNVTGLTDEELRRLEGTSRAALEARVQALRNIQILLDSAVVQMQQYSGITAKDNATETEKPSSSSSAGPSSSTN